MKKIMFITGGMSRGGGERVISILSNYFDGMGCEVHIVMLLEHKCEYKLSNNVVLHDITISSNNNVINKLILWMTNIRQLAIEIKPYTIVSFFGRINVITLFACIGLNQSIVVSERSNPKLDTRGVLGRLACRIAYLMPCKIVFQTKYQSDYFGRLYKRKSVVIPNPVKTITKKNVPTENTYIMAGRLVESKNYLLAINAFLLFASSHPGYRLDIYGSGEQKDQLNQVILENNAQEYIVIYPPTEDIHDYFAKAECFLLSSDYEGMSNSLLEAMSMGMACVTTAWEGVEEIMLNGIDGIITSLGDTESLANALTEIAENKVLASDLRENAYCNAKRFSSERIIPQWSKVILGDN